MKNKILISLEKLYDCGMKITLNKQEILIHEDNKSNKLVIKGVRLQLDSMWYLQLNNQQSQ